MVTSKVGYSVPRVEEQERDRILLGASYFLFGLCCVVDAWFLSRSSYAQEEYVNKLLFLTLLSVVSLVICLGDKDLRTRPRDRALLLLVFSLSVAGAIAWYQILVIPVPGNVPTESGGHDGLRYEYWGMYVAERWRAGNYSLLWMPFGHTGIVYVWAAVYALFGFDPHLSVMLNGFLFALTALIVYKIGTRMSGSQGGNRAVLAFLAMAESFVLAVSSEKETLLSLMFTYGFYRSWMLFEGVTARGILAVAASGVGLLFLRRPLATLFVACLVAGLLTVRRISFIRRISIVASVVIAVAAFLMWDILPLSGYGLGSEGVGVVELPSRIEAQEGSLLLTIGASEDPVSRILLLPLRAVTVLFTGSVDFLWIIDRAMQEPFFPYHLILSFSGSILIILGLPFVAVGIRRSFRGETRMRLYSFAFLLSVAGLGFYQGGNNSIRYRTFLIPVIAVLAVYGFQHTARGKRGVLGILGVALLVSGSIAYWYLKW